MEIQNSTNDDAMIKVDGGPSGMIKGLTTPVVWELKPGQKVTFSIEMCCPNRRRVRVTSETVKGLKLTKEDNGGYAIQVMNGRRRRRQ